MRDNIYKLVGTVCVPEEKKEEFNRLVLQILNRTGIRKTKRVSIAGKEVVTVERPQPDADGIVRFDYSIFERCVRKEGTYNMNICELDVPDRGYNAYGLVMNMIMTVQEAYSYGTCYMTKNGKLCSTIAYAATIKSLLGVTLDFPGRARTWDMCLFLRENSCEMNFKSLVDFYWSGYNAVLDEHLEGMMAAENLWGEPDALSMSREQIRESSAEERRDCAVQIMRSILEKEQKEMLSEYLKELLDTDIARRREMAKAEDEKGMLAEISLYSLPPILVSAYALACNESFWDAWDTLGVQGYNDCVNKEQEERKEPDWVIPYYKAIQRECEDEFLEEWDDRELRLSERMQELLKEWKEEFQETVVPDNFDAERILAGIVEDLTGDWGEYCRIPDTKFVEEFAENFDEPHAKALLVLRHMMDRDTNYFPELPPRQAMRWLLRNVIHREDFEYMSAYCSLLTTRRHRMELFGF